MKQISFDIRSGSKGQSFVELSLVALLLMLLVAGIAEFGVLLNRYLNILDGAREAARVGRQCRPVFCLRCNPRIPMEYVLNSINRWRRKPSLLYRQSY